VGHAVDDVDGPGFLRTHADLTRGRVPSDVGVVVGGGPHYRQLIAVGVGVVVEHVDDHLASDEGAGGVVASDRWMVFVPVDDGHVENTRLFGTPAVADHVGDAHVLGPVAGREGDVAPGGGAQRSGGRTVLLGALEPENVTVGVEGGGEHVVG